MDGRDSGVEFRILGQVELWADGKRYDLGSRKERGVLAVLLWELRPVPAETLVSRIWGDEPSDSAVKSLYENVSRLRRTLRTAGGSGQELTQRSGSYALDVNRQDVDLWRFRTLRDEARAAASCDDNERAFELLSAANTFWHGTPLHGLDGYWAEGVRVELDEERLAAAVQRIQSGLQLLRHADLVGEIAALVRQQPLNERLLDLYFRALHGSGRKAEALSAYHDAERRWREGYGCDLGSALRDLHRLMLRDDPTLSGSPPFDASPIATRPRKAALDSVEPPVSSSTMPRDNPDFTGRAAELRTLTSWLESDEARLSVPVVVISGMAGVGKTAFAVHAAHQLRERYPDQMYLPLRTHQHDGERLASTTALGTMLRMLGVPDNVIPADLEDRATLCRFKLAGRSTLILLDDALDADHVLPLLPGTPGCLVLVTSRRRTLGLPGMLSLPLGPLPQADALAQFARTAGAHRENPADRAAAASVVRLCGRVPLEIQVAGSRLRAHPAWRVSDLATRLRDMRSIDRDMNAALALSYRYLTVGQQRLFRWLALHPGDSFSVHAARAVAGGVSPAGTIQALEALLDFHLIEEPTHERFMFHTLVRQYAADLTEAVDPESDRKAATRRLLDYYLALADHADQIVHPFGRRIKLPGAFTAPALPAMRTPRECLTLLHAEKSSMLAIAHHAAANGWPVHAGLLAHLLGGFLDTWGEWAVAIDMHRSAINAWRAAGDVGGGARALIDLAFVLCRTGRNAEAADCARNGLAAARAASDRAHEAAALDTLGIILSMSALYSEALDCHDQALAIWRDLGDRHGEADAFSHSGMSAARLGRQHDAVRRAELAFAAYRELGDDQGATNALNNLGGMQQDAGCYDEALASYEQAKAAFLEIGDRQGQAIALSNIGDIRRLSGGHRDAIVDYRAALDIFRQIGDRRSEAETLNGMADALARSGDHQSAIGHYERALALGFELAERRAQATSHLGIGAVRLAMGQYPTAADDYQAALKLSQDIADPVLEGHALYGLGHVAASTEGAPAARRHWRAALARFEVAGRPEADEVRARLLAEPGSPG
jgi:tetratricopeptide (TPR) repeat protein/DNA-binding SARP family transcriptional activator